MSDPSSSPLLKVLDQKLGVLFGVQLISVFVCNILFGVSLLQTFIYYMSKQQTKDHLWQRLLPASLMLLQASQLFLLCVALYKVLIVNFGIFDGIIFHIPLELLLADIFQTVLTLPAQSFFVYRIWKFGRGNLSVTKYIWLFPALFMPVIVAQFAGAMVDSVTPIVHHFEVTHIATDPIWKGLAYAVGSMSAFVDIGIVIAMVWLLIHERKSSFAQTTTMINRLIILSMNSGLVTAIATVIALILRTASPNTYIFAFFYYPLGGLYCNSVLANLNARSYIRETTDSRKSAPSGPNEVSLRLRFAQNRFASSLRMQDHYDEHSQTTESFEMDVKRPSC